MKDVLRPIDCVRLFDLVIGASLALLPSLAYDCGFAEYDFRDDVYHGDEAGSRIIQRAESGRGAERAYERLPDSASDFYLFDGGNFGGSILYSSFTCETGEDCLKAFEHMSGRGRDKLKPCRPSLYAVVMEGPGFYHRSIETDRWDVRGTKNGVWFEEVSDNSGTVETSSVERGTASQHTTDKASSRDDEWVDGPRDRMTYYAIDLDRNRIYYHYESGGFRPVRYVAGRRSNSVNRE